MKKTVYAFEMKATNSDLDLIIEDFPKGIRNATMTEELIEVKKENTEETLKLTQIRRIAIPLNTLPEHSVAALLERGFSLTPKGGHYAKTTEEDRAVWRISF